MGARGEDFDVDRSTVEAGGPMQAPGSGRAGTDPLFEGQRAKVFGALFAKPQLRRIGRYIVLDALGEGGMGVVLKGYDDELDRQVAIKVLHGDPSGNHGPRLKREAQALAQLAHPNVVHVFEIGETDGQVFVAMELVKGQTLRQWHGNDTIERHWAECVEAYLQAGRGLAAAHAKGLVHRDFKPGNAIIDDDGRVRVLDFGLARRGDESDEEPPSLIRRARTDRQHVVPLDLSLTRTGAVLGTPAYMPLEQMEGQEADARSDLFSFCVSLYEAIYGERPFEGDSIHTLFASMTRGSVSPPPQDDEVPPALRAALLRGLATEPEDRWASMDELLDELERAISSVDAELTHLRRHLDLRIGMRARVMLSLFVGVFTVTCGLAAHTLIVTTGLRPGYPYFLVTCSIASSIVIGFIGSDVRRGLVGPRRRAMSLVSRTQMGLVVTASVAVVALGLFGLALELPIATTMSLVLLCFGLFVGAMAPLLPRMLVPATVCIASATAMVVWPQRPWLWWAICGGGGLMLMGWAWHRLSSSGSQSMSTPPRPVR